MLSNSIWCIFKSLQINPHFWFSTPSLIKFLVSCAAPLAKLVWGLIWIHFQLLSIVQVILVVLRFGKTFNLQNEVKGNEWTRKPTEWKEIKEGHERELMAIKRNESNGVRNGNEEKMQQYPTQVEAYLAPPRVKLLTVKTSRPSSCHQKEIDLIWVCKAKNSQWVKPKFKLYRMIGCMGRLRIFVIHLKHGATIGFLKPSQYVWAERRNMYLIKFKWVCVYHFNSVDERHH